MFLVRVRVNSRTNILVNNLHKVFTKNKKIQKNLERKQEFKK